MSNIPPPTDLPNFVLQQQRKDDVKSDEGSNSKFQAAIPAEKNTSTEQKQSDDEVKNKIEGNVLPALPIDDIKAALSPITEGVKNSSLFGWVNASLKSSSEVLQTGIQKMVKRLIFA